MAEWIALLPFLIFFVTLTGLKWPAWRVACITVFFSISIFLWSPEPAFISSKLAVFKAVWTTLEVSIIMMGALFLINHSHRFHFMDTLRGLVISTSENRWIQGLLVCFPLQILIEGTTGFGTPLILGIPLLRSLGFTPFQSAFMPLICLPLGVPFGALGTPLRVGFGSEFQGALEVWKILTPLCLMGPVFLYFYLMKIEKKRFDFSVFIWLLGLMGVFWLAGWSAAHLGPEFPALTAGGFALMGGVASIRKSRFRGSGPIFTRGLKWSVMLLAIVFFGKLLFKDQTLPGTDLKWLNSGVILIVFSLWVERSRWNQVRASMKKTFHRLLPATWTLFALTFSIQLLQSKKLLTGALASFHLAEHPWVAGWVSIFFLGTSTVSNLFLSKLVSSDLYPWVGVATAIGAQISIQMLFLAKTVVHDESVQLITLLKWSGWMSALFLVGVSAWVI